MKKQLLPSNFPSLKHSFSCIIVEIEDGWHGGARPNCWPHVRKTIYLVDGTILTALEEINILTNTVRKYQYDWEYRKGYFWKWHNEPHKNPKHITVTEPHHMHHQGPHLTSNTRIANWRHHDLTAVLETIRTVVHVSNH